MSVETITPEKAKTILEKHANYRKLRDMRVTQYARVMRAGKWHLAEPLMFDTDGNLINGQHRLHAVIAANRNVEFNIIRNVSPDVVGCCDTGAPRGSADTLFGAGLIQDQVTRRASILRSLHVRDKVGMDNSAIRILASEYPHLYPIYKRGINFVIDCFPTPKKGFTRAGILAAWGAAFLAMPDQELRLRAAAEKYFKLDFQGDADNSLRLLANFASGRGSGGGSTQQRLDYLKASSALRSWLEGIRVKNLITAASDPFPLPKRYNEQLRNNGFLFDVKGGGSLNAAAK